MRIAYRDVDRAPYLYVLAYAAAGLGLEIALQRVDFATDYAGLLVDGAVDVLAENYWGLQSQAAAGAPLVSVATTVTHLNERLFVAPGIATLDDLRGKRLAMRGQGPSALIARLWLEEAAPAGLTGSVVSEAASGRWGNWKAVLSGDADAAFVTNIHERDPLAAGLRELETPAFGFLGNITLTTTAPVIASRNADVRRLVHAAFVATRLLRERPDSAFEIVRGEPKRLMRIEDEAELRHLFEALRAELAPIPVPTAEAIRNTHRMRLGASPELAGFNPLLMWDLSFARDAALAADATPARAANAQAREAMV